MTRFAKSFLLAAGACLTAAAIIVGIRVYRMPLGEPETTNVADLDAEAEGDPPEFFVSDRALTEKSEHEIRAQSVDSRAGKPAENVAYFIELEDGRYAFGHTDASGHTRPVYTRRPTKHTLFWMEEAVAKWDARPRRSRD